MPIDPAYAAAISTATKPRGNFSDLPMFKFGGKGTRIKGVVKRVVGPKALANKDWKDGQDPADKTYLAMIFDIESRDQETNGQVFTHFLSGGHRWELLGKALDAADISKVEVGDAFMETRVDADVDPKTDKLKWTHEIKIQRLGK